MADLAAGRLSIGFIFSLMIAGLSTNLPGVMESGLTAHGVPGTEAARIAGLPPVAVLFAALLGYNPIQQLLGPVLGSPSADQASFLTGRSFFPQPIAGPFADGQFAAFSFAVIACLVAAVASWFAGGHSRGSRESVGCAYDGSSRDDAATFPPRPFDIRTRDLAPCSMVSAEQGSALGLDAGDAGAVSVNGQPSPDCVWLSDTDLSYSAQTIPIGAEVAVTEEGATVIDVNGFGAVRNVVREMTGGAPTCQVTVDAGPNQSIRVQAQSTGERPRTDDEMCRIATGVTGMVMTTVVSAVR